MAVEIDGVLVSDKERRKLNKLKKKPKKEKTIVGEHIYYIAPKHDNFRLYEWVITKDFGDNTVEVEVRSRYKKDNTLKIHNKILPLNKIRIEKE